MYIKFFCKHPWVCSMSLFEVFQFFDKQYLAVFGKIGVSSSENWWNLDIPLRWMMKSGCPLKASTPSNVFWMIHKYVMYNDSLVLCSIAFSNVYLGGYTFAMWFKTWNIDTLPLKLNWSFLIMLIKLQWKRINHTYISLKIDVLKFDCSNILTTIQFQQVVTLWSKP